MIKKILQQFFLVALGCHGMVSSALSANAEPTSHMGPTISAFVQRGQDKLPIYWVNHLLKGDKLIVTSEQGEKTDVQWLIVLATVTPVSNNVVTKQFDLSDKTADDPSIQITSDDQIPVIVIAPQVRTMFGLRTSFSESASLISDAIRVDPQRFMDLQKIDQINHAIFVISQALDAIILTKKPDQAIDTAKDLAAKFGVHYVNPDCFKDSTVNTKCVAASIVSSENLSVPSDDLWLAAGPNSASVKLPTDFFVSLKLITETSTYLVNKYGDNYDFAPSLGQKKAASDKIQLFTNARFKSGDVKTAYVYVPSWFAGKMPEVVINNKIASCLAKGDFLATVKGRLPLQNFWHDWQLVLREHGTTTIVAKYANVEFKHETGHFLFDYKNSDGDLSANGQLFDATLSGKFGFNDVTLTPFNSVLPTNDNLVNQLSGLDSLISGEQAKLHMTGKNGSSCIEQMNLLVNGKVIATSTPDTLNELTIDLSKVDPTAAILEVQQYGVEKQVIPLNILKRRAHVKRIDHYDLESILTVYGDNLDRLDSLQLANNDLCKPLENDTSATNVDMNVTLPATEPVNSRHYSCPANFVLNASYPSKVTVRHMDDEPASFSFALTKFVARPHMTIDTNGIVVSKLSARALQWNLNEAEQLITEDSDIGILLHAFDGYKLSRGAYVLQLKFVDDPQTEKSPMTIPLMSNMAHNELRTRNAFSFSSTTLPSIVNPVLYRVVHVTSGLAGDWQMLNHSIVYFPHLLNLSCKDNHILVHGMQLDLLDWASADLSKKVDDQPKKSELTQCGNDLCLALNESASGRKLKVKMHWIDDRLFDVVFPEGIKCGEAHEPGHPQQPKENEKSNVIPNDEKITNEKALSKDEK